MWRSEVGVFVHQVVEVANFPLQSWFVVHRDHFQQVGPANVCFETDYVLYELVVVGTEQDFAVILVLNEHLHGRLDQGGHSNAVGSSRVLKTVKEVALVVFGDVVSCGCAEDWRLWDVVVVRRGVLLALYVKTVVDFNF